MYLQEHIIHVWEETGADFHNCLIQLYCEKVQALMKEYLSSYPAGMFSLFWWEDQGHGTAQGSLHSVLLYAFPVHIQKTSEAMKELEQQKLWVCREI